MRAAIEYLTRLRDLSRKAAEAFDEDFTQQKSVYWRDFYAYDKAVDALMDAPQEPEASRINLGAFRDAVKAAMEKAEIEPEKVAPLCSEIIGALVGAMLGRKIDAATSSRSRTQTIDQITNDLLAAEDVQPFEHGSEHGRWIHLDMHSGMEQYRCSNCEQECYVPECMGEPMYAFCQNCGAKMDLED